MQCAWNSYFCFNSERSIDLRKWPVHWLLPFDVNEYCTKRHSMTWSRQSAGKVGVWRTPDETDHWADYAARIANTAITCMRWVIEKYTVISIQNLAIYMTYYIQVWSAGCNIVVLKLLDWWLHTAVISAALIYKLLKQLHCDAGCFPNNLTQSVDESVFQSVPHFTHVPWDGLPSKN